VNRAIRNIKRLLTILCVLTAALLPLSVNAQAQPVPCDGSGPEDIVTVTVVGAKGTSYFRITCVSHNGHFWTYRVEELADSKHDLSHWVLGIVTCLDNIVDYDPDDPDDDDDVEIGADGSTGFEGIKWNVENFTSGEFTIELDDDYPASLMPIEVLAKASTGNSTGNITGPDCAITAIELASFSAVRNGNTVSLEWETAVEIDNAGFNLYRAVPNGPLEKINDQLIAATGSGSSYSYTDEIGDGEFLYVLEDIDTSGKATRHVSIVEVAQVFDRMFLPLIGDMN
jgi:hypothetical protein